MNVYADHAATTSMRACAKEAMLEALDAGKVSWAYIRAILQDKQAHGVRCLADWVALDAKREEGRPRRRQNLQPACDRTAVDRQAQEDMERIRRMMNRMNEEDVM